MGAGNTIAWDSPLAFSIQLVPTGPSGAIANVMPAFTWNAVTGVSSYEVAVWDQNAGKTVTAIVSNASWTPSQPLNIEDSYEWWVGAIGANNKITWDSPLTFTIPLAGIGPSGIIAALQPSFTWNSLTGVSSYRFLLLNQTTNVTVANTVVSGTTWTPSQALTPGDQYEWWVGVAGAGNAVAWDNPLVFTIAPTAIGPSGAITTALPTFTWNPVTGVSNYQLSLVDQSTNLVVAFPLVNGTSWTPSQPLNVGDHYFWQVGAMGSGINQIGWSSPLAFTIGLTATSPSGLASTLTPTFTWNSITGVTSYEVALFDQNTAQTTIAMVSNATWTPSQSLNAGDNYLWWVGAVGANNQIGWDNPLAFNIAPTASGPSGNIATLQPTFAWNNVTGVTSYEVALYDQTAHQTTITMVSGTSWTPSQPLNMGDSFVWWVGAVGAGNKIGWDTPLSFTTPTVTAIGPSGPITSVLPTFSWNGFAGVSSYEVWLVDETTNQTTSAVVPGTSWTPSQPLNVADNYTWWVGAIGAGNKISWDSPLSFTIPLTPTGPAGTITTLQPAFTWNGITGVGSYEVYLLDQTSGQIVTAVATGTTWTPSQALNLGDKYTWYVGRHRCQQPDHLERSRELRDRPDADRPHRHSDLAAADILLERRRWGAILRGLCDRPEHRTGRDRNRRRHLLDLDAAARHAAHLQLARGSLLSAETTVRLQRFPGLQLLRQRFGRFGRIRRLDRLRRVLGRRVRRRLGRRFRRWLGRFRRLERRQQRLIGEPRFAEPVTPAIKQRNEGRRAGEGWRVVTKLSRKVQKLESVGFRRVPCASAVQDFLNHRGTGYAEKTSGKGKCSCESALRACLLCSFRDCRRFVGKSCQS